MDEAISTVVDRYDGAAVDEAQQLAVQPLPAAGRDLAAAVLWLAWNSEALLRGLIFAPCGRAMTPSHTRKGDRLYRYYVASAAARSGEAPGTLGRVSAAEMEAAVLAPLRHLLATPEVIARTWSAARRDFPVCEAEVRQALADVAPLWDALFPAEQARLVRLLVERVDVAADGLVLRLRGEGLQTLLQELRAQPARAA